MGSWVVARSANEDSPFCGQTVGAGCRGRGGIRTPAMTYNAHAYTGLVFWKLASCARVSEG